ncbi:hypothetical protein HanOQP8_Chr10g0371501 [Helianthus annuus]|nr:hypothetical protein HanOQP8_Chr10g0371501 [Helianthus annuus]KAJ0884340.1 hypothetical protein HanPSC8_Chr10g0432601 [Helianthus annuus]
MANDVDCLLHLVMNIVSLSPIFLFTSFSLLVCWVCLLLMSQRFHITVYLLLRSSVKMMYFRVSYNRVMFWVYRLPLTKGCVLKGIQSVMVALQPSLLAIRLVRMTLLSYKTAWIEYVYL